MRDEDENVVVTDDIDGEGRSIKGYIIGILVVLLLISCASVYFLKFREPSASKTGNYDIELKSNSTNTTEEKSKTPFKVEPSTTPEKPIIETNIGKERVGEEPSGEVEEPVTEEPSGEVEETVTEEVSTEETVTEEPSGE